MIDAPDQPHRRDEQASSRPASPIELHWHGEQGDRIERRWLVEDLIPETGKGLLSGQWGTAKTFTALDLAASSMTGLPFAGRRTLRQSGVLFIAAEGANEIPIRLAGLVNGKLRLEALATATSESAATAAVKLDALPFAWIEECPPLKGSDAITLLLRTAAIAAQRMTVQHGVPLGLIIIDTLAASADFSDANDAAEGQRVMNRLEELSRRTGAFVLAVDHFGKVAETGTRGSSAKEGAADVVLALLADRDLRGNLSNTRMAVRKLRGGATGQETPFKLEIVELDDVAGSLRTTCIVRWQVEPNQASGKAKGQWPKSLRVFERAMQVALAEHSEPISPYGSEGSTVKAVELRHVRVEFTASYPSEGPDAQQRANTKRKAFKDRSTSL